MKVDVNNKFINNSLNIGNINQKREYSTQNMDLKNLYDNYQSKKYTANRVNNLTNKDYHSVISRFSDNIRNKFIVNRTDLESNKRIKKENNNLLKSYSKYSLLNKTNKSTKRKFYTLSYLKKEAI